MSEFLFGYLVKSKARNIIFFSFNKLSKMTSGKSNYLSTSPNTTSSVPIMATMSASMWFLPILSTRAR